MRRRRDAAGDEGAFLLAGFIAGIPVGFRLEFFAAIAFAFAQQIVVTVFHHRRSGGSRHHGVFTRNNLFAGRFIDQDRFHAPLGFTFHQFASDGLRVRSGGYPDSASASSTMRKSRPLCVSGIRSAAVCCCNKPSPAGRRLPAPSGGVKEYSARRCCFLELVKAGKTSEGVAQDHYAPAVTDAAKGYRAMGQGRGKAVHFHGLARIDRWLSGAN